jgi:hypothetical protein
MDTIAKIASDRECELSKEALEMLLHVVEQSCSVKTQYEPFPESFVKDLASVLRSLESIRALLVSATGAIFLSSLKHYTSN